MGARVLAALAAILRRQPKPLALIRICDSNPNELLTSSPGFDELAMRFFGAGEASVYALDSLCGELPLAAAHYTTFRRNNVSHLWAIRICDQELTELGIRVAVTPGGTGVRTADAQHRDLTASKEAYARLLKRVHQAIQDGEDRVRHFEKPQIVAGLEALDRRSDGSVADLAKENIVKALARTKR